MVVMFMVRTKTAPSRTTRIRRRRSTIPAIFSSFAFFSSTLMMSSPSSSPSAPWLWIAVGFSSSPAPIRPNALAKSSKTKTAAMRMMASASTMFSGDEVRYLKPKAYSFAQISITKKRRKAESMILDQVTSHQSAASRPTPRSKKTNMPYMITLTSMYSSTLGLVRKTRMFSRSPGGGGGGAGAGAGAAP